MANYLSITVRRIFVTTASTLLPDGSVPVDRHEVFDDWTRVRNEWLVIRNGKVRTFRFHHTIYSGMELRERMERAGFVRVTLHGNLDGDECGPNAERPIAIGRKATTRRYTVRRTAASRNIP